MKLEWRSAGQRYYESGCDRGVLYLPGVPGVAWTGLIAVNETPSGGDPKPYYIDGIKYLNLSGAEEFEATIEAYSAPREFGPCDGSVSIQNGLIVTEQPRQSFSMSYRTFIGSDMGPEIGYKIHLVYNALTSVTQRRFTSHGEDIQPTVNSWELTTLPPPITGYRRTGHLVVDSRYTDPDVLAEVEDILYGSVSLQPSMPTPDELIAIFTP